MLQRAVEDRPLWYTTFKQQRLSFSVIPKLSTDEQDQFDIMLTTHWLMSGNSFSRVEEAHLKAACQVVLFLFYSQAFVDLASRCGVTLSKKNVNDDFGPHLYGCEGSSAISHE